ncbi:MULTISPECIES: TerD family protein [unclassified Streptomyces]|uniref:TerD family protein n=1 Tax=unclassified Streptomyces TaxID=2593676 RepID=UPI00202E79A0|nr:MULTISPECIES: TerD family protein [unclassified Streptomyces]MCM1976502.1 TerD family protein [Streptomyces sp. G1]MCX5129411.1 TerD family protein [Streptomyces sp. NBC_00347]
MSVNLIKGQTISLAKSDATPLIRVRMGLGWQAAQRKGFLGKLIGPKEIDLDASAVLYSGREVLEVVYFNYLVSTYGAVRHSGDNLTGGDGPGDDETIAVDFTRIPLEVDQIVFTVNSFTGVTFGEVEKAYCRLVDEATGSEIARYTLSGGGSHTALIMAKVSRLDEGWMLVAIGEPASGETFQALLPAIDSYL